MRNSKKIAILFAYTVFVIVAWVFIKMLENIIELDVETALKTFLIYSSLIIAVLFAINRLFERKVNFYENDAYKIGLSGLLSNLIDYFFIIVANWKLMIIWLPRLDFVFFETAFAMVLYFVTCFLGFKRTIGMKIMGLLLVGENAKNSKRGIVARGVGDGFLFVFFYYWVFGILFLLEMYWKFWKYEKTTMDITTRTWLVKESN